MKNIYALIAALAAVVSIAFNAHATDAGEAANVKVLWNKVVVDNSGTDIRITVTARLRLVSGTSFSAQVFPIIHSVSYALDYGEGEPQQVTLPDNGSDTTPMMTWTFTAEAALFSEKSSTMNCGLYFEDSIGKDVEIAHVEVNRSGTTGVSDIVAGDSADSGGTAIFTLGGVPVGSDLQSLGHGIYIVRQGTSYSKVVR